MRTENPSACCALIGERYTLGAGMALLRPAVLNSKLGAKVL
jgi:hypothetical protein